MKVNLFFIILGAIAAMFIYSAIAKANNEVCTVNSQFHRMECCVGDCDKVGAKVDIYKL